ncbi:hypothetical protein OJF2_20710 [Aquisphaera giovannonii]|uniref:Uncharacterized protein n=2 Tax=Aquisphaera giovannonii TaxID=406548 RepID=A0A5B9W006_9BACT|nr:hypothetical protein OJF2_20710 [Aquisphaera giovannonii]
MRLGLAMLTTAILAGMAPTAECGIGRHIDPAQVLPMDQLQAQHREIVSEVIRDHTFHRQGEAESFPCSSGLYLSLVNEPLLTLALWKDLADSPVQARKLSADRYQGDDGAGTTATWDFLIRTPRLHVLLAYLNYAGPKSNTRIDARVVLVLRSGYYREVNKEPYIQHSVEIFVKVDSKGWKTLARTARPLVERILSDQVDEAGKFISLMSRLVVTYPNWAVQVAANQPAIDEPIRGRFREIVAQDRRPNASPGRPMVMANSSSPDADTRRR